MLPSLARTGVTRLTSESGSGSLPTSVRASARAFASSPRELDADRLEFAQLRGVFDEAKRLKSLDGRPLAVLTAGRGTQEGWSAAQDELALLSTNSVRRTVEGASHAALLEDERFAGDTSRAIAAVVRAARSRSR